MWGINVRAFITLAAFVALTTSAMGQTAQQSQSFIGALGPGARSVSFSIQLEAGQIVTLTTSSSQDVDTVLTLNNAAGRRLAQNDDQQPGVLTSRIVYIAQTTGRHTAVVTGYNRAAGPFELNVTYGLDVGLSAEARVLSEQRLTFTRGGGNEMRFPVDLAANDTFVASTFSLRDQLDTTLRLVDSNGTLLAQNDDRGDGTLNSQLIYQAAAASRVELIVSRFDGQGVGEFLLSLALDPNAQVPFNFEVIAGEPIARYEGELNDAHPSRLYSVELAAGQTLLAVSDAVTGDLDTVLTLNDADGYPVALNDDRGDGSLNSGFAFTAPHAGTYELEISRYPIGATAGAYRLSLTSVDRSAVATLQALAENPVTLSGTEQLIETPNFRIYYTTEGRDASTVEYANAVAETLEQVLAAQTGRVGWAEPVRDADGRYRAYVANANGDMGYTRAVQIVFDNPHTANVRERTAARTVFVIDNDFANMGKKASPISLMRATATHEFNHVVQYGYDAQEPLNWLYESTASWTETTTVGEDQDATDYVALDFAAPQLCWTTNTVGHNYAQWTLLQSIADVYGERLIVQFWENTVTLDGFETMSRALTGVGTTIPDVVRRWRVQNFAMDYDLAPRFTSSVALGGTIRRNGLWSPRAQLEQLGASYVRLDLQGSRMFELRGDANLELVALGVRNGQVEVIPLGRGGVFNTTGFEYAALMVFNHAMPAAPGECSATSYSINVSVASVAAPSAAYQFSAEHFQPPS